MSTRLCIFATHPVQYHVPLWRALAAEPGLEVTVYYLSDHGIRPGFDEGFGVSMSWDVDLQSGYHSEFLTRGVPLRTASASQVENLPQLIARVDPEWIMIPGYSRPFERQLARLASSQGRKLILRGEFSDSSYNDRSLAKQLARSLYLRWFYSKVERFCYPGALGRRHLIRHGVSQSKMFFSPYSVDDATIGARGQKSLRMSERARLGIQEDDFMFLMSGKLIPRKDPLALLEAIRAMPSAKKIGLIALGDGELRAKFDAEARALLGSRYIAPGFVNQSQLARYFQAADGFVMPSHFETWGLVVNEAMHFGLPVIVSDRVGCYPDLVVPGRTGHVYPRGDNAVLGALMQQLAAHPERSRRMGDAARERVNGYTIAHAARGVVEAMRG